MVFMGACLLVLASGCSQTSQAAGKPDHATNQKQTSHQKKQSKPKSELSSFNWKTFQKKQDSKQSKPSKPSKTDTSTGTGIIPTKIRIPAINVKTQVIEKGIVKKGTYAGHMATPDNAVQVAWFKLGPKPGNRGSAIIAGHVDTYKGPGVFFNLKDLKKGDMVYITGKKGKTLTFKVFDKRAYPRKSAPVYKVFGYTPARVIRLLTCTGTFDYKADTHNERLVVSAKLVQKNTQKS